jgi:hypothetical protein
MYDLTIFISQRGSSRNVIGTPGGAVRRRAGPRLLVTGWPTDLGHRRPPNRGPSVRNNIGKGKSRGPGTERSRRTFSARRPSQMVANPPAATTGTRFMLAIATTHSQVRSQVPRTRRRSGASLSRAGRAVLVAMKNSGQAECAWMASRSCWARARAGAISANTSRCRSMSVAV